LSGRALTHARAIRAYADGEPLKPSEKQVLMLLADSHNGKTGQCNPAIKDLVLDSGLSRRAVLYAIGRLADAGFIVVKHGKQGASGRQGVNEYSFPGLASGVQPVHPLNNEGVQPVHWSGAVIAPHQVQSLHPTGAVIAPPTTLEPEVNRNLEPEEDEDGAGAPAAAPNKPIALNVEQRTDLRIGQVVGTYFELFACPVFTGARDRISRDLKALVVKKRYTPDEVAAFLVAVGKQHPDAKRNRQYLDSTTIDLSIAAYRAAGCPDELTEPLQLRQIGGTYDRPVSRLAASSQRIADADRVRAAREQWQAGGLAASAG
jgi:hypothetical protein